MSQSTELAASANAATCWLRFLVQFPVSISVSDTGIGTPADRQDEIFEEFRQLPAGAAEGGTGLGLALTRQLVVAMGGRIELASGVGQGGTFTLRMQAA